MGQQKRERKLTGRNTLPAVCRTKGLSKSREVLAGYWPASPTLPEAERRGEGKGANSTPKMALPTTLQTGLQFRTRDFLRFWMVDIRREGPAKLKAHATDRRRRKLRLGPRRGEGAPHPGECARQAPGCLSCSGREGIKRRHSGVRAFVEHPRAGTARNAGPAPYRAAGSLSSVDGEGSAPPSPQGDGTSEPE